MTKTGIPYLDFTWSPCGFGCSKGCPTCWARKIAKRIGTNNGCPDCLAFRPHFHPERLAEPSMRRKPAVIGVDFYADLFDPQRAEEQLREAVSAMHGATQHEYVLLTERPGRAIFELNRQTGLDITSRLPDNWFIGATIRNQDQADVTAKYWSQMPGRRWLSLEPLEGPVHADWNRIADSIIIGCDNQASVPFEARWVMNILDSFSGPVYVKQIRDAKGRLTTNLEDFPLILRRRELPWKPATKADHISDTGKMAERGAV